MRLTFLGLLLGALLFPPAQARAAGNNDAVTVPLILGDYYAWAYTESLMDRSYIYTGCTAGVDGLGWLLVATEQSDTALKFINLAGLAKTVYPVVELLDAKDMGIRQRAWIALGTHSLTLLSLEIWGHPAITIQTLASKSGAEGLQFVCRF